MLIVQKAINIRQNELFYRVPYKILYQIEVFFNFPKFRKKWRNRWGGNNLSKKCKKSDYLLFKSVNCTIQHELVVLNQRYQCIPSI